MIIKKGSAIIDNREFSFTTANESIVTDIDGNVYHTVTIGVQTWLVENLKTTHYNDGTLIPNVTDNTEWRALTTGAWCDYNNDTANDTKYGKLYWYAVNTGKLAPTGWHIPTDAEWTTLENYVSANLGSSGSVTKALAAKTGWAACTDVGTTGNDLTKNNSTGFTALPGGDRTSGDGNFNGFTIVGHWWSSTSNFSGVRGRWLSQCSSLLFNSGDEKKGGLSVRCVKNY